MAGLAIRHLGGETFVSNRDPGIIAIDRDLGLGLACAAAALGLLLRRARRWVAASLILAISYTVSARRLAGALGPDALAFMPIVLAAFFVWWPPLIEAPPVDE